MARWVVGKVCLPTGEMKLRLMTAVANAYYDKDYISFGWAYCYTSPFSWLALLHILQVIFKLGGNARRKEHEKVHNCIVIYVGIVKTFLFKFFKFRASIL